MRFAMVLLVGLTACGGIVPPAPPAPRTGTDVLASRDKAWDAVIEVFAEKNIQVRTMEKASGFIAAEPGAVGQKGLADCGKAIGVPLIPDRATYNVLVRGDEKQSSVKVTVRFTQGGRAQFDQLVECSSLGVWESSFEERVKAIAEGKK